MRAKRAAAETVLGPPRKTCLEQALIIIDDFIDEPEQGEATADSDQ